MKTKEEKAAYCREWRVKNREQYLTKKKECYRKNVNQYREEAKVRAAKYYKEVLSPKRKKAPELYKILDRQHSLKRRAIRREHLKSLREGLGGQCVRCGYKEVINILQFHHHEKNKESDVTSIQNYKKREIEAAKCILLCPNCHAIEHLLG